jgi:nucleoside 2-deoxyribosyltransferase
MLNGTVAFDPQRLFEENRAGIEDAQVVVAVLDGPDADSGTCFECGYAHKLGRPVVGVRTDLRRGGDDPGSGINLMLSRACTEFISVPQANRDDIEWVARKIIDAVAAVLRGTNGKGAGRTPGDV